MDTVANYHRIMTPYVAASRKQARALVKELGISPGDIVEVNARNTCTVSGSFTDELVIALMEEQAGSVLVRGTVPGMFSGIQDSAAVLKAPFSLESIPFTQRPQTKFL